MHMVEQGNFVVVHAQSHKTLFTINHDYGPDYLLITSL